MMFWRFQLVLLLFGGFFLAAGPASASVPREMFFRPVNLHTALEKSTPPSENRVGGSEGETPILIGIFPVQGTESHRVVWLVPVKTASGLLSFLQPDPIRLAGGPNLYTYCANNPINFIDPLGLYTYTTENTAIAFLHEANPFNADGAFWRGSAAFVDGVVPFVDPLAYAGAYDANDSAFQVSQAVGGVTRDVIAVIGGGGIGTVARAEGITMSAGQRFLVGELGPSVGNLLTSAEPLSQASLWAGYALKWGGRVDSFIKISNALDGGNSYEQSCPPK